MIPPKTTGPPTTSAPDNCPFRQKSPETRVVCPTSSGGKSPQYLRTRPAVPLWPRNPVLAQSGDNPSRPVLFAIWRKADVHNWNDGHCAAADPRWMQLSKPRTPD
jgi:hypothetical protein